MTRTDSSIWTQRYRLSLGEQIYPLLRVDASGYYEWLLGDTTLNGAESSFDNRTWSGSARLTAGNQFLGGSLEYSRQEQGSSTSSSGQVFSVPDTVRESYGAHLAWRPADLPSLDLRALRTNSYDKARATTDTTVDELGATVRYEIGRTADVRYSAHYTVADDHLHLSEYQELSNAASANWADRLLDGRLATAASYNLVTRTSRTLSSGGGTVATLQPALRGLSTVEAFPTPDRTSLVGKDNPALVDGVTAPGSASTGVDLGFGPSLGGDTAAREVGVQFAAPNVAVDMLYLWVDQALPPDIAALYQLAVWRSDDGATWTQVALAPPPGGGAPVQFSAFESRFEISFAQVQAPYLKVVAHPLQVGATTDPRFTNVRVTELQALLVVSAAVAARETTDTSGNASVSARYAITRGGPNLAYDFTAFGAHAKGVSQLSYSVVNGLSASQRVWRIAQLAGRLERSDSAATGIGHEGLNRANVSLMADFLPTLSAGAIYTGLVAQRPAGTALSSSVSGLVRADLYSGVNLSGNAGWSIGYNEHSQTTKSSFVTSGLTLVPNRALSLTGSYNYTATSISGGGLPEQSDSYGRIDASASLSPFPALSLAGSLSRYVSGRPPDLVLTFTGGFSPFPGGQLALRFSYTETRQDELDTRARSWGPGARWNLRGGSYLDVSYTVSDSSSTQGSVSTRGFVANVVVLLP